MKMNKINNICILIMVGLLLFFGYCMGKISATNSFCEADPYNAHCVVTSITYGYEE